MNKTTFQLRNMNIHDATSIRHCLSMNVGIAFSDIKIYKNTCTELSGANNDYLEQLVSTNLKIPYVPNSEESILYYKQNLEILTGSDEYIKISDNILLDTRKNDFRKKNLSITKPDEYKIVCNVINNSFTDVKWVTTNDCVFYKNGNQIENIYTYFDVDGIYLFKLNPALKEENKPGEEVHFEAVSTNGIAVHHAKYKVFTNAYINYDGYENYDTLDFNICTLPHPAFNWKSILIQTIDISKMYIQILLEKAIAENNDNGGINKNSIFVNKQNNVDNNIVSYILLTDNQIQIIDDLYCKEQYSKPYTIQNAQGQKPSNGKYFYELKNERVYIDDGKYHFDDIKYPNLYTIQIHMISMCTLLIVSRLQQHKNVLFAGEHIENIIQEKGEIKYTLDDDKNHTTVINDVFTEILNFFDEFINQIQQV